MKGVWILLFGLLFTAAGGVAVRSNRRLAKRGQRVQGTVVDLRWSASGGLPAQPGSGMSAGPQGIFYPVLSFRTLDGEDVQAVAREGGMPAPARKGQQVQVLYDPANPQVAEIDTVAGRGTIPIAVVLLAGIGLIVYSIFYLAGG